MGREVDARPVALMSKLFQLCKSVIVQSTLESFRAGCAQGE
jgi:hypothetical protein